MPDFVRAIFIHCSNKNRNFLLYEKALLYSEKILELPDEKAFTFLYVIVRNTAYDMIKVESRNNHEELTYEDGEDSEYLIDPNDVHDPSGRVSHFIRKGASEGMRELIEILKK